MGCLRKPDEISSMIHRAVVMLLYIDEHMHAEPKVKVYAETSGDDNLSAAKPLLSQTRSAKSFASTRIRPAQRIDVASAL